ncbi:MAG: ATP-binding protein, partial [Lachnospiraceae bacterium]|nr:ATP-binding protein [Lachnospiraceae bacterium]
MEDKDLEKLPVVSEGDSRYHFQVNLGGMLDILSNHLYKSPDVFIRELLQNGVDAITMRQKRQPEWREGAITITIEPGRRIEFSDNGAGLTEEEIHRFLAVIGSSSKTQIVNGEIPEDYIGRFGIGLLSCFMVSDSIVVHTVPADGSQANMWIGHPDGTYTLEPLDLDQTKRGAGTTVILHAKKGEEHYFRSERVEELVRYYGLALPVPVYLAGNLERINNVPADFSGIGRSQLLSFGNWLFDDAFLDGIPIQTSHLSGVAYILPYRTDPSVKSGHRIYLKHMLLTEEGNTLLPSWAFFMRCFLNTRNLRPTASREDFYEDQALTEAREEFEEAVRYY